MVVMPLPVPFIPMDGTISQLADTLHALGIEAGGVELLIHVGVDTVEKWFYACNARSWSPGLTAPEAAASTEDKSSELVTATIIVVGCPAFLIFSRSMVRSRSPF